MQNQAIKRILKFGGTLVAMALLGTPATFATVLFSENFESGLNDGKWTTTGSAFITTDPKNSANHVVAFGTEASGGDLFSIVVNFASDPNYKGQLQLSFDVLHTGGTNHAYIGTDHVGGPEQWLWSDDGASPFSTPLTNGVWTHVSFWFPPYDPGNTGSILIKMEAVPSVDFFDNFALATSPEPGTFGLAGGMLALGLLLRKRLS